MKWLLITTRHTNPGDEFARIGVENLIKTVDVSPEFDLLNKENPEHWKEREFDRCIYAGMPLWWSMHGNECQDIFWWEPLIRGWPTKDKNKFMVLGSGSVYVDGINSTEKYLSAIRETMDRAWAVTTRNTVLDHPALIDSVCPATFALNERSMLDGPRVCNLMPSGGHFPMNPLELEHWDSATPFIVDWLQSNNYVFVAHTSVEAELAKSLGWAQEMIRIFDTPEQYLTYYASASSYFGNRLHGGAVCASIGIPTWCVTHDSRMKFVRRLSAMTSRPSEIDRNKLRLWLRNPAPLVMPQMDRDVEFNRLRELLTRFKG